MIPWRSQKAGYRHASVARRLSTTWGVPFGTIASPGSAIHLLFVAVDPKRRFRELALPADSLSKEDFGRRDRPLAERRRQLEDELPRLQARLDALRIGSISEATAIDEARDLATRSVGRRSWATEATASSSSRRARSSARRACPRATRPTMPMTAAATLRPRR